MIQRKLGDLESIRLRLGLSQRKMCQLLFVDPSAWTRWTKLGEDAPPHIYRMLQWYMALEEKYPALDPNFWLSAVARPVEAAEVEGLSKKVLELETRISEQARSAQDEKETELAQIRAELRAKSEEFASFAKIQGDQATKQRSTLNFELKTWVLILSAFAIGFMLAKF